MKFQLLRENLRIGYVSIRSHRLRSVITILIIAFGITALIGILTAIDAIKFALNSNFSSMGANTFSIQNREMGIKGGNQVFEKISWNEAIAFKERFDFPSKVSLQTSLTSVATIKFRSESTNPNISVQGIDENYFVSSGYELKNGRNFSSDEVIYGDYAIIIGSNVDDLLFKGAIQPEGHFVLLGNRRYLVIGVLKEKGSSIGFSGDNTVFIPLQNARNIASRQLNFTISVTVDNTEKLDAAINEATQMLRIIRKDKPGKESSFEISKSSSLANMLIENIQYVTMAATLIGLITLLGAAIGLMNIMLVTVTERTREIGIRKAIGATPSRIRKQFLIEAVLIGQMGGIVGMLIGIPMGNLISFFVGTPFIIPWGWILFGIILCFIVGVASGWYPARKAAALDPVEALRYE